MGKWKLVVPEATTNKALNPSAETTGNFAALTTATVTRSTSFSRYGAYSYRVQTSADNEGVSLTLSALANAAHYVTLRVRGTLPASWDWSLDDSTYTAPELVESYGDNWSLYGLSFVAAQANGSTTLYVRQNGAGSGDFYVDGVQVEEKAYWTTYCDGDQNGCSWAGQRHGSTSSRDGADAGGGRVRDWADDFDLPVERHTGAGMPPVRLLSHPMALLPGELYAGTRILPRQLTIKGTFRGDNQSDFHDKRQEIVSALNPFTGDIGQGGQRRILRYTGATVQKEAQLAYAAGLEAADIQSFNEEVGIDFIGHDPLWRQIGEQGASLNINTSVTATIVAGRIDGLWDNLGPPNASGTYTDIRAVVADEENGYVYFGGTFANFDNIANGDGIIRYDVSAGTWNALGTGTAGVIHDLAVAPDGTLYAVGTFTSIGGTSANRIASWDGSSWSALGTGLNGTGFAVLVSSGRVWVGGAFTTANGVTVNRFTYWNGTTFVAVDAGPGLNGDVLTISRAGIGLTALAIGGDFTAEAGGGAARTRVATVTNPEATPVFGNFGVGLNNTVRALMLATNGILYAGGDFTQNGDSTESMARFAKYQAGWKEVGGGVDAAVHSLAQDSSGNIWVGGAFATAGSVGTVDGLALWDGSTWTAPGIDLNSTATVYAIAAYDDDIYIGFDTDGTTATQGTTDIAYTGTAPAYPRITIARSGGTAVTVKQITNTTTGATLYLDYDLADGETLTMDFAPGDRGGLNNLLANSDAANFFFAPGSTSSGQTNTILLYVVETGSPTTTALVVWRNTYLSVD